MKVKALRYGESGSGKTVMAGTWPVEKGERILVFDFDNDTQLKDLAHVDHQTFVDEDAIETATQIRREPQGYMKAIKLIRQLVDGESDRPAVVVVDSLSGLHDVCMNLALQQSKKGYNNAGGPGMEHYALQMWNVDQFLHFCLAGVSNGWWNLDVVGHQRVYESDLGGLRSYHLDMTGKKPDRISRLFDEFYHHEIEKKGGKERYVVQTRKSIMYPAKSRLGWNNNTRTNKLDEMEEAHWVGILKKVGGG